MRAASAVCFACICVGAAGTAACSRSNNLLFGRVQALVGSHMVVVTDCYRLRVPRPEKLTSPGGSDAFRFMPCRDADVLIEGDGLSVNGRHYGHLNPADDILVDHGVVSIHRGSRRRAVR
jgi:hypothetical protein